MKQKKISKFVLELLKSIFFVVIWLISCKNNKNNFIFKFETLTRLYLQSYPRRGEVKYVEKISKLFPVEVPKKVKGGWEN